MVIGGLDLEDGASGGDFGFIHTAPDTTAMAPRPASARSHWRAE
jgi:hypothetical protein